MSGFVHAPRRVLLAAGETMAMVTPASAESLVDANVFRMDAGGAESNVAAHAAAFGTPARWFSRLGDDPVGHRVARQLAERGVDVSDVEFDAAHPTGLYVKDPGNGVRYYRAGSAAAQLTPADAERIDLEDVALLHVSGITAAISRSAAAFVAALIERALRTAVQVSFDVNHRAPLWDAAAAAPALLALARRADIVFVGRDEAEALWATTDAASVRAILPDVPELVVKDGGIGATVFAGGEATFAPAPSVRVVEAVGAGDAFAGAYLSAVLEGGPVAERLRRGHDRAALTLMTTSDFVEERAMT